MSVRISAVICTFNRACFLQKAISSLVDQTLSEDDYEILVVDNGSVDTTREVVLEEFRDVKNLHYIYEPILGLSQARNTGWRKARGEYVAYLDDDAIAYDNWLERIVDVFEASEPNLGCIGGRIDPIWEVPRPSWVSDRVAAFFTILDLSGTPIVSTNKQVFAGANIAFPKQVLKALGGFSVDLGRKGNKLMSCEEIMLWRRLKEAGYFGLYHPEIAVRHHVPALRVTKRFLAKRTYWEGVSEAVACVMMESPSMKRRVRMALWMARRGILRRRALFCLLRPTDDPMEFERKCLTWVHIGYCAGMLGLSK
jgi:glycosyltransferase involved in cell wall biosynthesis